MDDDRGSVVAQYREDKPVGEAPGFDVEEANRTLETGLVFQPAQEALPELQRLDQLLGQKGRDVSYARVDYAQQVEAAINEQINVEYSMSYLYHQMSSYFSRDNVGLPGFAAYFKHESDEERSHAQLLMDYQSRRGGRTRLAGIAPPQSDFTNDEKGDALYAAELALSLEKLNFVKLRELHTLAEANGDADLTNYIEEKLLDTQAQDVKEASVFVSQLQRAGRGVGTWHVDQALQRKYGGAAGAEPTPLA